MRDYISILSNVRLFVKPSVQLHHNAQSGTVSMILSIKIFINMG